MDYSVVGLGKLGASMAAAIASRGHRVVGVDVLEATIESLNMGKAPVHETGLVDLVAENRERLSATSSHRDAVLRSQVSFVVVPTPSDSRGAFSLEHAKAALEAIGAALREKSTYHLVVMASTVLPGSCRYGLIPILERESGKRCGVEFGFCYSPEFIALGSVIRDFLNPDFTLVGELDARSGELLERAYAEIMTNSPPCRRMSLENAELAKISLNAFVTVKITFANMLADLCERIPGGDVDVVTHAIGSDTRIGSKYLRGGLGFGGPCFPRDNVALDLLATHLGGESSIPRTTHRLNLEIPERLVSRIEPHVGPSGAVAVLGLSYKPHSHVVEESQSVMIANAFARKGARVTVYDPLVNESTPVEALHDSVRIVSSARRCIERADVVIIATPDPELEALEAADFTASGRRVVILDCWRLLEERLSGVDGITYLAVGVSSEDAMNGLKLRRLWEAN